LEPKGVSPNVEQVISEQRKEIEDLKKLVAELKKDVKYAVDECKDLEEEVAELRGKG
jgi:phage shock protein A